MHIRRVSLHASTHKDARSHCPQEWLTKGGGLAPQDKNVLAAPDHAKDEANDSNDRDQVGVRACSFHAPLHARLHDL
eukprot:4534609-Pleurochrysis_carterae.AAC.5